MSTWLHINSSCLVLLQTAPDAVQEVDASQPTESEAQSSEEARREEQRRLEEQISATLNNIQLSRGVDEIIEGDYSEEDVEQLEDDLEGCDGEYTNLFATLDQLGSCLDEVCLKWFFSPR